jgi:hypothetical protein
VGDRPIDCFGNPARRLVVVGPLIAAGCATQNESTRTASRPWRSAAPFIRLAECAAMVTAGVVYADTSKADRVIAELDLRAGPQASLMGPP